MRRLLPLVLVVLCGCPVPAPGPSPEPSVAPFPADGLHVLVVYETKEATRLTDEHREILFGLATRDFLRGVCAMEPDGKTRAFRFYDPDTDTSADLKVWQGAMAVPRQSLPWLCLSNGETGYSGPLPETEAKFREIVNQHAR